MIEQTSKKPIIHYFRPLPIVLSLSIVSVSFVSIGALVNHMDVPTFIASFSTKKVTVSELKQGKLKNVIFIDVRTLEEYNEDRIAQSILVPITDIQAGLGVHQIHIIAEKNAKLHHTQPTIVLYCTKGPRSVKAYQELSKTGLNLVVLEGGIRNWRLAVPPLKDAEILAPITQSTKSVNLFSYQVNTY